jgi:precorrin-6B methylase 1
MKMMAEVPMNLIRKAKELFTGKKELPRFQSANQKLRAQTQRDHERNYDIDGVSKDEKEKVIVSGDKKKK